MGGMIATSMDLTRKRHAQRLGSGDLVLRGPFA
jgi:hypothetical protein